MTKSKIWCKMLKAVSTPTSETFNVYNPNETVVTNRCLVSLPDGWDVDNGPLNYKIVRWYLVQMLEAQASRLASRYLDEGFKGRVHSYLFVVTIQASDGREFVDHTQYYDLSRADKKRMAKYAEWLCSQISHILDEESMWEEAQLLGERR